MKFQNTFILLVSLSWMTTACGTAAQSKAGINTAVLGKSKNYKIRGIPQKDMKIGIVWENATVELEDEVRRLVGNDVVARTRVGEQIFGRLNQHYRPDVTKVTWDRDRTKEPAAAAEIKRQACGDQDYLVQIKSIRMINQSFTCQTTSGISLRNGQTDTSIDSEAIIGLGVDIALTTASSRIHCYWAEHPERKAQAESHKLQIRSRHVTSLEVEASACQSASPPVRLALNSIGRQDPLKTLKKLSRHAAALLTGKKVTNAKVTCSGINGSGCNGNRVIKPALRRTIPDFSLHSFRTTKP